MDKNFLKLTNTVYKILAFFPEADPLKVRAREKSLAIMENLTLVYSTDGWALLKTCFSPAREKIQSQLLEDIVILLNYLKIGKSQEWISDINYLIISNEYEKIKKEIESSIKSSPKISETPQIVEKAKQEVKNSESPKISVRQNKIIKFLENNEKAQVMDLKSVLPNVTKRTIRRDLDELLDAGKIARLGEFNQVFYKII